MPPISAAAATRFDSLTGFLRAAAKSGHTAIRISGSGDHTVLGAAPALGHRPVYVFAGPLAAKFVAAVRAPEGPLAAWARMSEQNDVIMLRISENKLVMVETWVRSFAQGWQPGPHEAVPTVSMNPEYSEIFTFGDWGGEQKARAAAVARFEDLRAARHERIVYNRWNDDVPSATATSLPLAGIKTTATLTLTSGVDGSRRQEHRAAYILYDQAAQIVSSDNLAFARVGEVRMKPSNLL